MKILLADDSRSAALAMTARLNSYGYTVILATDGQQAVEAFRRHAPDLVLMDLDMPRLNGFDATARIRAEESAEQGAWTPVIFLTASSNDASLVTAIEAGADDFICKSAPESVLRAKMIAVTRIAALRQRLYDANRSLRELADLDGLTHLPNRRSLDARVEVQWQRACDAGRPFGVLMVDIDHFKAYNDGYSHWMGDDCLRKVALALQDTARRLDSEGVFAARYGGEEFALVGAGLDKRGTTALGMRSIAAVIDLRIEHSGNPPWGVVTISAGAAWCSACSGTVSRVFRDADEALYAAKRAGRNRLAQSPSARD